jgi:large subunit ribosomal protein L10
VSGLAKKKQRVESLHDKLSKATVAIAVDYRGLTMAELTTLRNQLYKENARFTVTKNTLMRRAYADQNFEGMNALLKGPTAFVIGHGDQVKPAKIVKDFFKTTKKEAVLIKGAVLEGKLLSRAEAEELASLPPLDELRAKLLGCIAGPQQKLVGALSQSQRNLVSVLDQIAKQKEGAA